MNNCVFIGRLGHDVSLRYSTDGNAVGRFSMALDNGKNKNGERVEPTWIDCVAFGKTAEAIERFFHKGNRIGIVAHARENKFTDRDGNERKKIEFVVDRFDFTDDKKTEDPAPHFTEAEADAFPW